MSDLANSVTIAKFEGIGADLLRLVSLCEVVADCNDMKRPSAKNVNLKLRTIELYGDLVARVAEVSSLNQSIVIDDFVDDLIYLEQTYISK